MAKYRILPFMALLVIGFIGQVRTQYSGVVGEAMETISCIFPGADGTVDDYDNVQVYKGGYGDDFADATELIATKDEPSDLITFAPAFANTDDSTMSDKYGLAADIVILTITLEIMNLELSDHASYFCNYRDETLPNLSGAGKRPDIVSARDLCIIKPPEMLLLSTGVTGAPTSDKDDALMDTNVVSGDPVTFTCTAENFAFETGVTIAWVIDGVEVQNSDPGITIDDANIVQDGADNWDATSTLTFTPQLNEDTGVVASDDDVIECLIHQPKCNGGNDVETDVSQRLNVLFRPNECYFEYDDGNGLDPYTNGATIDVVRGQVANIAGVVEKSRDASSIEWTTEPTPSTDGDPGTDVETADPDDNRLIDTSRTYSFNVDSTNDGDTLAFTANTNAFDLANTGSTDLSCSVTLNVIDGPNSEMEYTHPVTNNMETFSTTTGGCDVGTDQTIQILERANVNDDLTITCRSVDVNPAATIRIYQGDGPDDGLADDTLLVTSDAGHQDGTGPFNTEIDYTLTDDDFSAVINNGDIITCAAENGVGPTPAYSSACLVFLVEPASIVLHEGTTGTDAAEATEIGDEGAAMEFNCLASDASPAAGVEWGLASRGGNALTDVDTPAQDGSLWDTTSVLSDTYMYQDTDCGEVLMCTTDHPESGNNNPLTDQVTLQVRVPPDSVTIEFLAASDGPASLSTSSTTPLTTNEDVSGDTICVIHGQEYQFQGTAFNEDPDSDFTWERRTTGDVVEATLRTNNGASNAITCTRDDSTDIYTIADIDCDVFDDKKICVEADNGHFSDPEENCVTLDVKAEVKTDNMEIIVRDAGGNIVNTMPNVNGDDTYFLTDGVVYSVDCVVTQAKEAPSIDLDLGEDDLSGVDDTTATSDPNNDDNTVGNLADLQSTGRDTFTADQVDHCGEMLVCKASNTANELLSPGNRDQTIQVPIQIIVPPTTVADPVISMVGNGDPTYTDGEVVTLALNSAQDLPFTFRCTSSEAEETPDITWNKVKDTDTADSTVIDTDILNDPPDCTLDSNTDDVTITPTYTTYEGYRLECVTSTSVDSTSTYILITVDVAPIPDSLTMYVGDNDGGDPAAPQGTEVGEVTHEVDEGVDLIFTCWIMDANPPASITWTLDGSATGLNWLDIESDPVDGLSDTINSLEPTYHEVVQGNCGEILQCASTHPETGDAQTDETELRVIVSPDDVDLELLASSDPAALTGAPGTDIGAQFVGVGENVKELVLVCGHDYNFESTTTNGVTPEADFTWERRSDPATAGTEVDGGDDPAADPDTVTCSPAPTTSNLVGFTANHNDDNGQYLCAIANNKHADDPVDECVLLDVNVEVQAANMEMTVKRSVGDTVVDFAGGDTLIDGEQYYVDCTVKEATPPPAFTISLGGVDLGTVTTPSPDYTDQAEGAAVDRANILTSARVTFTADYATHCIVADFEEGLICEAVNSVNTLLNSDPQTVSEMDARVELEPSSTTGSVELAIDPTTTTNADQDGDDVDTTAILIDGLVYDFKCDVTSDPEVEVVWNLNGAVVQTDASTSESIDCDSGPYMRTYQLTASHADHQCETLSCTAGGVTDMITFQILKPPTMDAADGEGIELRYRESDDGSGGPGAWMDLEHEDNLDLTADKDYEFECKVLNVNPVSPTDGSGFVAGACPTGDFPTAMDVVDIDFCINIDLGTDEVCNDGDKDDMEPAEANGDLFDLTDTHTHTVGATDDCGTTIICRAAFDPDGGHANDADSPFIRVTIARTVLPAMDTVTLTLNPIPNADQDGDDVDETAILIEDLEYNFDCKVESDPDVDVRWYVRNAAGVELYTQDDINTPDAVNCDMNVYTETYQLRADRVTYADLQCGYIECIADPDGPTPITKTITFQIWKPPTIPDGGGGGGPGIQLSYMDGADMKTITHDDTIDLDIATTYEFKCKVLNINPVSPAGTSGFVEGACDAGDSAVSRDIVDIDFCIDNDFDIPDAEVTDMGVQLDSEPATANGDFFDLTDTYMHMVDDEDECGTTVTCKVAYDPTGAHGDVTDDSPFITVKITHVSETTAVTLIPPEFGDDVAGAVDGNKLSLYDGDTYTLTCVPEGADPDADIQWYLVDDCTKPPAMDDTNGAQLIRNVFIPHETVADCDLQNDPFPFPGPADHAVDYDIWDTFFADFENQNDKCLRCVALDTMAYDDFTLDIRKAPSEIIAFDGPTDDDGDGLMGTDDRFASPIPVCAGEPFDIMLVAKGANPAVNPFTLTLDGATLADDSPKAGIEVDNVLPADIMGSDLGAGLFDSIARVAFPAGCLTLDDNDETLQVCDPESNVCSEFTIMVVEPPAAPLGFTVSDPFASERDPEQDDPHVLTDGDKIRLHLDDSDRNPLYSFTCTAEDARPAAELIYQLSPANGLPEPFDAVVTPNPDTVDLPLDQLFNTVRRLSLLESDFSKSGRQLCCRAKNTATDIGCDPSPVESCVEIEIIDEPSDLKMLMTDQSGNEAGYDEVGDEFTELKENDLFDFRCISEESAPAADIKWYFTPRAGVTYDLIDIADEPVVDTPGSSAGHVDTLSTITFSAVEQVQGGTLRCCAEHVAIPGGTGDAEGDVYDEDPELELMCVETLLRFPVAPSSVEIWDRVNGGSRYVYEENQEVRINLGEQTELNCTSYESRPYTYIGWSGDDLGEVANRDNKFISSDCAFTYVESNPDNDNPLTTTYDTTKCVVLNPEEIDHMRRVYCTATNIANTIGEFTFVTLYLCVPCSLNLHLTEVTPSGNLVGDYDNGGTVILDRNGNDKTVACINTGARERPNLDVYLWLPGDADPTPLSAELVLEEVGDNLWSARKDVTLSLGGEYDLDGATLECRCINDACDGEDEASIFVNLVAFDTPPVHANTHIGTGNKENFEDIDGGLTPAGVGNTEAILYVTEVLTGAEPDPYLPPNFPVPASNIIDAIDFPFDDRRKREVRGDCGNNQFTCYTLGTKPAVDFIWKLDDQVLSGGFINSYSEDSILNTGPSQGLVDSYSTLTFDPVTRGLHSRELCCELSSSDIGSPIRRCTDLIVFSGPNSPLELSGTTVVNEGQTVQLRCLAEEHYPAGVFQWEDSDGSSLPRDEAQTPTQLHQLPNFRLEQFSDYSFVASREHNGKEITCTLEQDFDSFDCDYDQTTSGQIELSVNFCPVTNAVVTGCPSAPVSPGRAITLSCQSAVSNPALRLDWYLNNVAQSPSGASTTQARDYGYVTIQTFTTRQLGLADDGLQLQCCPAHLTDNIGCGQLCSSVCTVRVEQPAPDVGCRWIRVEMTLEHIDGSPANWIADYATEQSAAYRTLTDGLEDVLRQVFDGLPDYRSAIVPTIRESGDGLVQVVAGLEFDAPYASTPDDVNHALADAINANGNIVTDGGNVSPYDVLPNSATAVCVCPTGFCVRGPDCRPSNDDFSSSCECPANYSPPRCDVYVPPGPGTQPPPSGNGVKYGRLAFILQEINDIPALWDDDYNDATDPETIELISGLDQELTAIFSSEFTNCFQNVRISDLFQAQGGGIGVVAGVEFTDKECGVSVEDIRREFFDNIDHDQKIGGSIYELDPDYLQETNVEEVCGNDFSCSNGGWCVPSDTVYYSSCRCQPGYSGSRCQDLIEIPRTDRPEPPGDKKDPKGLSTEALIGIIIGVVLFMAILLGLCLLCCFLCGGDRERTRTRYVYTDDEEPAPRRGYTTPPEGFGSYPRRGKAYDDWPWSSDGRPPVKFNANTFDLDFEGRRNGNLGPRPML